MTLVEQDLRCDVLRSTADSVCALGDNLCETVVDEFEVAVSSDHDVFGLQVAIDDVLAVQVLEDGGDLRAIKPEAVILS